VTGRLLTVDFLVNLDEALHARREALTSRPNVSVEVEGRVVPKRDRLPLLNHGVLEKNVIPAHPAITPLHFVPPNRRIDPRHTPIARDELVFRADHIESQVAG